MRSFLVIAHKFEGEINLKDLPGSGRIDVVTRCINAAIFLSHDIRRDVLFYTYFPKIGVRIKIDSRRVKYLNPDERSTAALIKKALERKKEYEVESTPGFFIRKETYEGVIDELTRNGKLFYLKEDGMDIRKINIPKDAAFILGDNLDLTEEEEKALAKRDVPKISVSPRSILSSHVIIIVHNELDRRGL